MRTAIYTRVSTTKQECDNQLLQLRDFAAKQGWDMFNEYVDVVTGSGRKKRPAFEAMTLAASQREFDMLLFWKLDRLSREGTRKTLHYLECLDGWGVSWRSFTEPYFDSCGIMRDVVISIMATLAEQERILLSERTKAGLHRVRRAGRVLGRRPVKVDLVLAHRLRADGIGLRGTAEQMGVSVNTLRKALLQSPP